MTCEIQHFYVEPETVNQLVLENRTRRIRSESFEAALRVRDARDEQGLRQGVEHTAHGSAMERLSFSLGAEALP
jgi:hypothetical protein